MLSSHRTLTTVLSTIDRFDDSDPDFAPRTLDIVITKVVADPPQQREPRVQLPHVAMNRAQWTAYAARVERAWEEFDRQHGHVGAVQP